MKTQGTSSIFNNHHLSQSVKNGKKIIGGERDDHQDGPRPSFLGYGSCTSMTRISVENLHKLEEYCTNETKNECNYVKKITVLVELLRKTWSEKAVHSSNDFK